MQTTYLTHRHLLSTNCVPGTGVGFGYYKMNTRAYNFKDFMVEIKLLILKQEIVSCD